jgi:hypothetical protein
MVLCGSLVELVTRYGLQDLVRLLHVSPQDQGLVLNEAQQQSVAHNAAEAGQVQNVSALQNVEQTCISMRPG